METMTAEAIELMCDADKRPHDPIDTMLIRLNPLPLSGGDS